jgi:hypothetical protein
MLERWYCLCAEPDLYFKLIEGATNFEEADKITTENLIYPIWLAPESNLRDLAINIEEVLKL